jgi:hypothetical protein
MAALLKTVLQHGVIIGGVLALAGCAQNLETASLASTAPGSGQGPLAFKPTVTKTGVQCLPDKLAGKWSRMFPVKDAQRGIATWTFAKTGEISCAGPGCAGSGGLPVRYDVKDVWAGQPDANVGLHVTFQGSVMHTTCEIDGKTMHFGNGANAGGLTFLRQ